MESPEDFTYNDLKAVASENHIIFENRQYTTPTGQVVSLAESIDKCIANQRVYINPTDFDLTGIPSNEPGVIEVVDEGTIAGACRLVKEGFRPVALNYANPVYPGGGYCRGAKAQEECICRSSMLFYALIKASEFYEVENDCYATDSMILTPDVPVIRTEKYQLIDEPIPVSFITCSACVQCSDTAQAQQVMRQRIRKILLCAIQNGYKSIVLGAFGCGAFRNSPTDTAESFRVTLIDENLRKYFTKISFSIPNKGVNFQVFHDILMGKRPEHEDKHD